MSPRWTWETESALFVGGFVNQEEICRRLGCSPGELESRLDQHGLSRVAMLPVEVNQGGQVFYRDLGRESFSAPLFDDVSSRASSRLQQPPASMSLSAAAILSTPAETPHALPAGFIFHTGRCGSNLLCNLLTKMAGVVTLREPEFLNTLILGVLGEQGRARQEAREALTVKVLRGLAFGARYDDVGKPRRCVVKFSSWNALWAERLFGLLPQVPAVIVVRSPWESIASFLQESPRWYTRQNSPPSDSVERFAQHWTAIIDSVLKLPRERIAFVGYEELVVEPLQVLARLSALFGLNEPPPDADTIRAIISAYSKSSDSVPFDSQGRHRRVELDDSLKDIVTRIASDRWDAVNR